MKNKYILLFLLFFISNLYTLHYYSKDFYYSVDLPDSWELIDDAKVYNVFFKNEKKNAFFEITAYDKKEMKSNELVLDSFIKRYKMNGNDTDSIFCQFDALRGTYSLIFNGMDLRMDIVVFSDKYSYYVIMAYAERPRFNIMRGELNDIINSFKIYYDNNVVYSNDGISEDNNKKEIVKKNDKSTTKDTSNKNIEKNTVSNKKEYYLETAWDKYKENFKFFEEDYDQSINELKNIISTGIWSFYGIDTKEDKDYNFTFWSKFYQDVYNKNYYRVTDIVEWFEKEAKAKKWSAYTLTENVMKSIQVIPYERPKNVISDKKTGAGNLDYFTPNEVAWYNKGDCDSKSLFMVLILRRLGFDAVMYYSFDYGHAMAGININANGNYKTFDNKKYYFIESTYSGWKIGDLPQDMGDTKKWRLIPIK